MRRAEARTYVRWSLTFESNGSREVSTSRLPLPLRERSDCIEDAMYSERKCLIGGYCRPLIRRGLHPRHLRASFARLGSRKGRREVARFARAGGMRCGATSPFRAAVYAINRCTSADSLEYVKSAS